MSHESMPSEDKKMVIAAPLWVIFEAIWLLACCDLFESSAF
jgi:hypothetical protein